MTQVEIVAWWCDRGWSPQIGEDAEGIDEDAEEMLSLVLGVFTQPCVVTRFSHYPQHTESPWELETRDGTGFHTTRIILTTEGRKNWKGKKPKRRNNVCNSTAYLPILELTDLFMFNLSALPHSIQDASMKISPCLYPTFLSRFLLLTSSSQTQP